MSITSRCSGLAAGVVGAVCILLAGCDSQGPAAKALRGTVTCAGEKVLLGQVTFIPLDDTSRPSSVTRIVDGHYHVTSRGGLPLGKYRVCVDARKKTGRKVQGYNGTEEGLIDEEIRLGSAIYAGEQSPLSVVIHADSEGVFDIAIPQAE